MILEISWFIHYNSEIDWKIEKVKMIRCLEKYKRQWRPKQGKLEWQKQKEKEKKDKKKKKKKRKNKRKKRRRRRKNKKERTMEVKKIVEEWEIWNEEREATKSEEETKKLVSQRFHK